MNKLELSQLLALMLVAGGPREQPARLRWPLHVALRELVQSAHLEGQLQLFDENLVFRSSPEYGQEAIGADRALQSLVQAGLLRPAGRCRRAVLVLDGDAAVLLRRQLMSLSPSQTELIQRAGERWAALAATIVKNRSRAARSSGATISSSMPNALNPEAKATA